MHVHVHVLCSMCMCMCMCMYVHVHVHVLCSMCMCMCMCMYVHVHVACMCMQVSTHSLTCPLAHLLTCGPGWSGARCNAPSLPCPHHCSGHAAATNGCVGGLCTCLAGWQGADCSEPTCVVRCSLAATLCIMGCNPVCSRRWLSLPSALSPRVPPGALPAPRPVRARRVRVQRRLGGRRVRGRLVRRLLRPRHVHGARLRLCARLARRALRVGHVPRPYVDGGGLQVGLVQRPRRLRRGRVPVRCGVGFARLRRERALASNGRRRRVTAPVTQFVAQHVHDIWAARERVRTDFYTTLYRRLSRVPIADVR
jgi:hypothetical protein